MNSFKLKKSLALVLMCCLVLMIPACSKPATPTQSNQTPDSPAQGTGDASESSQDPLANLLAKAPKEPTNLEEFVNYPVGPLAGRNFKEEEEQLIVKVKEALPPYPGRRQRSGIGGLVAGPEIHVCRGLSGPQPGGGGNENKELWGPRGGRCALCV